MEIIENNLFFSKVKNDQYKIFASIEEYEKNEYETAIWTDTIHFENDTIKYKFFKNIEEARLYILKQLSKF